MPSVLVTGAARGIGRAIVEHLAATGWDVIAGVRSEGDAAAITKVSPQRVSAVILDVTDAGHIAKLSNSLPDRLDGVVNNAGMALAGPVEGLTAEQWREVLETNTIGPLAVTREVLPRLRRARGRIVFISSVGGRVAAPLMGGYSASKFALEAAADALRMELMTWGIPVIVIEPGHTDTDMWRTADDLVLRTETAMSPGDRELYAEHLVGMKKFVPAAQKVAVPAAKVVEVVDEALTARRPKARYVVGLVPKLQVAVLTKMPAPLSDRLMTMMLKMPRRRGG
jgi:NAD(P)-dependent dehydrogenase (short-subunit alcohol dehydrogenase family)